MLLDLRPPGGAAALNRGKGKFVDLKAWLRMAEGIIKNNVDEVFGMGVKAPKIAPAKD
jgi:hypothetical protein